MCVGGFFLKELQAKWLYRLGIIFLLFLVLYVFMKLQPLWQPLLHIAITVLIPFIIAGFITYLLHPVIEKLHQSGMARPVAILIIYLLFFGGIGYGFYRGIPVLINQLKDLSDNFPVLIETYRSWIETVDSKTSNWPAGLHDRIEQTFSSLEEGLNQLLTKVLVSIKTIVNSVILVALIPFIVFYMLKDYDQMKKAIWYLTPRKWRKSGQLFLKDVDESLGSYIRGQLFVCFLIGLLATIGLWIFNMKYPLLLGILIGITNVIPYFGPVIGAVPAMIIAATISVKMTVAVVVIIFLLQFIEGNLLSPIIVGKSLHMHPIIIMFSLLLGGEIGGVLGLIIAVPIVAVLKVTLLHVKAHFIKH